MCAIEAGRRGRRVAVLEHAEHPGKKILISGGGRCNFTNLYCAPENFISNNPHFAKSALARYTPADFIALIEKHHIPYHEKTLGQLFCDHSAQDILGMLESECAAVGVQLFTCLTIREVRRTDEFIVLAGEKEFRAPVLVVATGGLSIPKMGATDFGYGLARKFNLAIRETRPGLCRSPSRKATTNTMRIWLASPPKSLLRAAASASASRCSSRIADSVGQRSCRFRHTGDNRSLFFWISPQQGHS